MSEGIITANLGNAKYSVQLVYDLTGWNIRWDNTLTDIANADIIIAAATPLVNEAYNALISAQVQLDAAITLRINTKKAVDDVNDSQRSWKEYKRDLNIGISQKYDAQIMQRFLNSTKPNIDMIVDIYCADFDDTLAVGLHVGLLEINNENTKKQGYLIHPNKTHVIDIGGSAYSHARDGSMESVSSNSSPANFAFNYAMFIGWQRFQPLYRKATVNAVYPQLNVVDVILDAAFSSRKPEGKPIDINRNPANTADMLATTNVPVWYMDSSALLNVGDNVVVLYENQDRSKPRVIGFDNADGTAPPHSPPSSIPAGSVFISALWDRSNKVYYTVDSVRGWAVSLRQQVADSGIYTVTVTPLSGSMAFIVDVDASGVAPHTQFGLNLLFRTAEGFGFQGQDFTSSSFARGFFNFSIDLVARTVTVSYANVSFTPLPQQPQPSNALRVGAGGLVFFIDTDTSSLGITYYSLLETILSDTSGNSVFEMTSIVISNSSSVSSIIDAPFTANSSSVANLSSLSWSAVSVSLGVTPVSTPVLPPPSTGLTFIFDNLVYPYTHGAVGVPNGAPIGDVNSRDLSGIGRWSTFTIAVSVPPSIISYVVARVQVVTTGGSVYGTFVFATPTNGSDWSNLTSLTSLTMPGDTLSAADLALLQLQTPL